MIIIILSQQYLIFVLKDRFLLELCLVIFMWMGQAGSHHQCLGSPKHTALAVCHVKTSKQEENYSVKTVIASLLQLCFQRAFPQAAASQTGSLSHRTRNFSLFPFILFSRHFESVCQFFFEASVKVLSADRDSLPFFPSERLTVYIYFFSNHLCDCALSEGNMSQTIGKPYLLFRNLVDFYRTGRKKHVLWLATMHYVTRKTDQNLY